MKTRIGSMLLVAAIFVSVAANAQKMGNRQDRQSKKRAMMHRDFRAQAENTPFFTEEQKEAVKEIRLETAKEMKLLRNQLHELKASHQTLTTAEESDLDAIYESIDEMADVKTEMAKIRARQQQQIRGLLTEEQLLKFDNRKKMMRNKMHRSFRNGGEGRFRSFDGGRKG